MLLFLSIPTLTENGHNKDDLLLQSRAPVTPRRNLTGDVLEDLLSLQWIVKKGSFLEPDR